MTFCVLFFQRDSTDANSSINVESSVREEKNAKHGDHSVSKKNVICGDTATKVDNDNGATSVPLAEQVVVKCGVCKQEMDDTIWDEHMQTAHNYLAWKEGESSLVGLFYNLYKATISGLLRQKKSSFYEKTVLIMKPSTYFRIYKTKTKSGSIYIPFQRNVTALCVPNVALYANM